MTGGDGFVLGVDFGTSNTVAMLRRPDGRVTPLLFDGTPVLPSAVFAATDGTLFVGRDALHHGRHRPDGLEPNPKRHIDDGTVLLSGLDCAVPDLVGAVLGRVAHEATRVAGHRPETLVLSHPAGWGPVRRLTLSDAAAAVGLPPPVFVPEPVAAAMYFTSVLGSRVPDGAALLVYDLGAGTFDVTVLRAGASFEVLGSDGLDDVGGLDVDGAVVAWLRDQYDDATWHRLTHPATDEDRRLRLDLWSEARMAKEMLSRAASVVMRPPLLRHEIPLTLSEFERVTRPLIDRTVRTARGLARYCEVTVAQVLLVGGSSRIPLVATALHRAFGVPPTVTEQPETVVAEGCVFAPGVPSPVPLLLQGEHDPVALSTVLPIGAGLTTEPWTGEFTTESRTVSGAASGAVSGAASVAVSGALPAAPLGRSVLPAVTTPGNGHAPGDEHVGSMPIVALKDPVGSPKRATVPATAAPAGAVATLPASALPPGTIPEARPGEVSVATGLLWPPLPPTIASHPLAGGLDATTDTARLAPVSPAMSLGPSASVREWPGSAPPTAQPTAQPAAPPEEHVQEKVQKVREQIREKAQAKVREKAGERAEEKAGERAETPPALPLVPRQASPASPANQASPVSPARARPEVEPPARPTEEPKEEPTQEQAGESAEERAGEANNEPPEDTASVRVGRSGQPGRARIAVALLACVLVLAAAAVTLIVTAPGERKPSGAPPFPTWAVRYADSLGTQRGWSAAADLNEKVECAFRNGRLEIDMRKGGIFRCPGQRDELTDFALRLDVFLLDGKGCAGIWFRRGAHEGGKDSSYVLKVCRTELALGHHHADGDIAEFARFRVDELGTGVRSVVGLVVRGSDVSLYLDDRFVGAHKDAAFASGRLALGIAVPRDIGAGRVGFSNVELRTP